MRGLLCLKLLWLSRSLGLQAELGPRGVAPALTENRPTSRVGTCRKPLWKSDGVCYASCVLLLQAGLR